MRLPFGIDGTDFSADVGKYGQEFTYEDIDGGQGGYMQDGSYTVDIIERKAVVVATCNPLRGERLAALLQACAKDYVSLTYFDTKTNREKTGEFRPTVSPCKGSLFRDGIRWFTGAVVTMRER